MNDNYHSVTGGVITDIVMREAIRQQTEYVHEIQRQNAVNASVLAYHNMMQDFALIQNEIAIRSVQACMTNPSIYTFGKSSQVQSKPQIDDKKELLKKDKAIKVLQKKVEGLTNELEHERTHSDNQHRIIKWLSGDNGSLYKSDVEEDSDE